MTLYAQIWLILAICGRIYGQKWPDLWPNEIVGMAMAIVAIPDITSMVPILLDKTVPVFMLLRWMCKGLGALIFPFCDQVIYFESFETQKIICHHFYLGEMNQEIIGHQPIVLCSISVYPHSYFYLPFVYPFPTEVPVLTLLVKFLEDNLLTQFNSFQCLRIFFCFNQETFWSNH